MRTRAADLGFALVTAVVIGCTGGTHKADKPRSAQSDANRPNRERVMLQGCLEPGSPADGYVLRKVSVPPPEVQPQGQATMEHGLPVAQGAWVRLTGSSDDLMKNNLGKRVVVWGEVVQDAPTTRGTSGRTTPDAPSRDSTPAPGRGTPWTMRPGHDNEDGPAPQIAVEKIQTIADSCGAHTAEPSRSGK